MAHTPRRRGISAGIARIAKLGRRRSGGDPEASPEELDRRLPEQRILDTAARYPALGADSLGRHRGGSTTAQGGNDAAASADPDGRRGAGLGPTPRRPDGGHADASGRTAL